MTGADQQILEFAAEHRAILTPQIAALLHIPAADAEQRLAELARQGLIRPPEPTTDWPATIRSPAKASPRSTARSPNPDSKRSVTTAKT